MAYFDVVLVGKGISLPVSGTSARAIGFYVSRIVRAPTEKDAATLAKEVVSAEWRDGRFTSNQGAHPSLAVESISRLSFFGGLLGSKAGYSFYSEESDA